MFTFNFRISKSILLIHVRNNNTTYWYVYDIFKTYIKRSTLHENNYNNY